MDITTEGEMNMTDSPVEDKDDQELGRIMNRSFGDRYDQTKEHYFATNPEMAARRYLFDERSRAILGDEEWAKAVGE